MSRHLKNLSSALYRHRSLSTKLDQRLAEDIQELEDDDKPIAPAIRYNVCRDKTSAGHEKYQFPKTVESEEQRKMEAHHMQMNSEDPVNVQNIIDNSKHLIPTSNYRQFEASSTYKNLVLPLKSSKLADPFPTPVKMMRSHTVSDQEKAEQMLAERRIPRNITRKKY